MKNVVVALTLVTTALTGGAATGALDPKSTLAAFHAALATGDESRALSMLAEDAVIYESGHVERSRDEYARHHLKSDMAFARTTSVKTVRQTERTGRDVTLIWQETETTGTSGGQPIHLLGLETAVLEKRHQRWAIVHLHWSSRKAK